MSEIPFSGHFFYRIYNCNSTILLGQRLVVGHISVSRLFLRCLEIVCIELCEHMYGCNCVDNDLIFQIGMAVVMKLNHHRYFTIITRKKICLTLTISKIRVKEG